MSTTRRSIAALFAVTMLFVAGACSSGSSKAKTSSDTSSSSSASSNTGSSSDTSASSDTGSSSDTFSSDTGSFSDSGSSSSSSGSSDTAAFCQAVDKIKQATKDINAANASGDDTQYKAAIDEGATAFEDLADAAPSSQQSDAQFIAQAWVDFNQVVQSTSAGDSARETARQKFASANDGSEVTNVDAYINRTC